MKNKIILILFIVFFSVKANAYIGLGPLIPVLGSLVYYIFIFLIVALGILIYPIKALFNKLNRKNINKQSDKK